MTVLILAPERDITADRMVTLLGRRGMPTARVDTASFPKRAGLDAEFRGGRWHGTLRAGGRTIALEGLRSVWYRSPSAFRFDDALSATERRWAMTEAKLGVGGVLTSLPARWINHPNRNADVQASAARDSSPLWARCAGHADHQPCWIGASVRRWRETVAKALGAAAIVEEGGRKTTFTHRLDDADLGDLRGVEHTAHQFQTRCSRPRSMPAMRRATWTGATTTGHCGTSRSTRRPTS